MIRPLNLTIVFGFHGGNPNVACIFSWWLWKSTHNVHIYLPSFCLHLTQKGSTQRSTAEMLSGHSHLKKLSFIWNLGVCMCARARHTHMWIQTLWLTALAQGTYSNSHSVVRPTLYLSLVSMYFVISTQLGMMLSWSHEGSPLYPQHPVHRTWQPLNLCGGGRSNWSSRSTAPSGLRLL